MYDSHLWIAINTTIYYTSNCRYCKSSP